VSAVAIPSTALEEVDFAHSGRWTRVLTTPQTIAGISIVGVLIVAGILAPLLARVGPTVQNAGPPLTGPSASHILGTDEFGRDLFSRVLFGLRIDIELVLIAVPIGAVFGTAVGLLSFLHPATELAVQRLFDVVLSFPRVILAITIAVVMGAGQGAIIVAVALVNIPVFGRLTRSSVLSLREREYVLAADVLGVSRAGLLLRHILPNSLDVLVVQVALSAAQAVFLEGAMSFLGLGVPPPNPSLGGLLEASVPYMVQNASYALGPILIFFLLVLGWNLLADGITAGLRR
jgi:peptide/nickel transport system permease protein